VPLDGALEALRAAEARRAAGESLPLYGIPFAVKDNIDVAGMPTTAACPAFAYVPERHATIVERLLGAGAILVGKTNLDQFATGLVGTRSPYGACASVYDSRYISGGSSSGSALAVALELVSFALGTDTAGSGRVPAAFNGLFGYKPTRGVLSTAGVVPACRSLDCVSVFARTASDVERVLLSGAGVDARDPFTRPPPDERRFPARFRFGVPAGGQLEFFGDLGAKRLFEEALSRLAELGGERVSIDYTPFREAAELLYGGPWIAERLAALEPFLEQHPQAVNSVVYGLIQGASRLSAADAFRGMHRLQELKHTTRETWSRIDLMVLPTTGTIYTIDEVLAEPLKLNSNLGYYTNFVNLLDLSAVALPAGFRENGLPFGISLIGRRNDDHALLALAGTLHGSSSWPDAGGAVAESRAGQVALAVVGAHLSGQPLNHELTGRGARLLRTCRTSLDYRLFALTGTVPPKPGLVRAPGFVGPGIEVEVWELALDAFGSFVDGVPAPLAIGTLDLDDGTRVHGFVCEPYAIEKALEITQYGGWRGYRLAQNSTR